MLSLVDGLAADVARFSSSTRRRYVVSGWRARGVAAALCIGASSPNGKWSAT